MVTSDSVCTLSADGKTKTCTSTGDGYDGATYTLTITIETVQFDAYKEAWNTDYEIGKIIYREKLSEHIIENANEVSITSYTDGNTQEAYTFEHEKTEQTEALTDYRYIGDKPNNYVYFNCTDEDDVDTCETWRIIGVFKVEDENGNKEERVKLIRNESIGSYIWNTTNVNEWNNSSLESHLKNSYYGSNITYLGKK